MSKNSMLANLIAIAMICILVTWFLELVPLNFVIFLLVVSNAFLILQTNKIETTAVSRNYRFSRTYNQFGEIVGTRWTEVVEDGYWVTIVTDKDMNLYAEHTRSDENAEKHRDDRDKQESDYNKSVVWGEIFPKARKIKHLRERNQSLSGRLRAKKREANL
jgi:hypothetical protein